MRNLLCLCVALAGCAPAPVVKLRVDPVQANRLDASARQNAAATVEMARKSLASAEMAVKAAETEHAALPMDDKTPSPELDAIKRAAAERHTALVAWRKSQLDVARWQVAAAEAQKELLVAEAVFRTGADIDPARFRAQAANLQSGRMEASKGVAHARAMLDDAERALSAAKDRYAATVKAVPPPPAAQPAPGHVANR